MLSFLVKMNSFDVLSFGDVFSIINEASLKDILALSFSNKQLSNQLNTRYVVSSICNKIGITCNKKVETFNELFLYISTLGEEETTRLVILSINEKNKELGWIISNYGTVIDSVGSNHELYELIYDNIGYFRTPTWVVKLIINIINKSEFDNIMFECVGDAFHEYWCDIKYSSLKLLLPIALQTGSSYEFLYSSSCGDWSGCSEVQFKLLIDTILNDQHLDIGNISSYYVDDNATYTWLGLHYELDIVADLINNSEQGDTYKYTIILKRLLGNNSLTHDEIKKLLIYLNKSSYAINTIRLMSLDSSVVKNNIKLYKDLLKRYNIEEEYNKLEVSC